MPLVHPELTQVVVSDIHSNIEATREGLRDLGVINSRDERCDGYYVVQVGDCVTFEQRHVDRDTEMLEFSRTWFDICLLGNRELWHAQKLECGLFSGLDRALVQERARALRAAIREQNHFTFPTFALNGWLVSHAGVHAAYQKDLSENVTEASAEINRRWLTKVATRKYDALFDSYGLVRSTGEDPRPGGLFWCDALEVVRGGSKFSQIIGHTPLAIKQPLAFEEFLLLDPGSRRVGMICREGADHEWYSHTYLHPKEKG